MCGIVSHLVCVLAGAQGHGVAHASALWSTVCLSAYCIASTNKIPTALAYFLAACFLTSGMTYLPNISIDDITLSCGIVSVAIRNCNSSTPMESWILMALRQLSGSPA